MNPFKLILAPKVHLARLGTALQGGGVVTELVHPAADDPAWQNPGCLDNLTPTQRTQADDPFNCYDDAGNLTENTDDIVIADGFQWKLERTNDLVTELVFGLSGPVVQSTPMLAYSKGIREIQTWLKIEGLNAVDKTQFVTLNIFGRLKLTNLDAFVNGKSKRPEVDFEKRGTALPVIRFGPAA